MKSSLKISNDVIPLSQEEFLYRLSLESNLLSNVIKTFRQGLPTFVEAIKNSVNLIAVDDNSSVLSDNFFSSKQTKANQVLSKINYLMFSDVPITIPENFKGHLDEYVNEHYEMTETLYVAFNNFAAEFSVSLSSFITNKDERLSSKVNHKFIKEIEKINNDYKRHRIKYYPKDTGITKSTLNKVIRRPQDFDTVYEYTRRINTVQSKSALKSIKMQVDRIIDLLNIISTSTSNNMTEVSPEAANSIASTCFAIAKLTEIISINYHDSMKLLTTVERITDIIIKQE